MVILMVVKIVKVEKSSDTSKKNNIAQYPDALEYIFINTK